MLCSVVCYVENDWSYDIFTFETYQDSGQNTYLLTSHSYLAKTSLPSFKIIQCQQATKCSDKNKTKFPNLHIQLNF
jgi:hypothetical protein